MKFESKTDLKEFSKILQEKLLSIGEKKLVNELREWDEGYYTTSSEFLGEMKLILEKIVTLQTLDKITKKNAQACLLVINKAFEQ